MFSLKTSVVAVLLAATISPVVAFPLQETNAQRMARGLPPSPPRFGRALPGKEAREPTPAQPARRASTSPTPPISYSGRIQARKDDGGVLGFVRDSPGAPTISGLNFGADKDLRVSFSAPSSGVGPFDILATNPTFPAPFFVGASGSSKTSSIGPKRRDTVAFTNVKQTPPGSVPVASDSGSTFVESAIWSLDPGTKELKAQYVNPDNSKPATFVGYDIRENKLFFVGDIAAFNQNNDEPASAVKLFLV